LIGDDTNFAGSSIVGLIAGVDTTQLTEHQLIDTGNGSVVSVVPADFDGDLKNDLLVATRTPNGTSCRVYFQNENLSFGTWLCRREKCGVGREGNDLELLYASV